jgi:poly-beta-1,6-N-acetyl-D-glucosamine synthase
MFTARLSSPGRNRMKKANQERKKTTGGRSHRRSRHAERGTRNGTSIVMATKNSDSPSSNRYVLVTAARNEEKYIEQTLRSVTAQTVKPIEWVIMSDGSTDRTDEIVSAYAHEYPFVHLSRITDDHPRNFAAQVMAINAGCELLRSSAYDFIGNLDADVRFEPHYFETLLQRFAEDDELGCAGGFICEEHRGEFRSRLANSRSSVAHAVQFFRRECFEQVCPYMALRYGGPDWVAEVRARQKGWKVKSFADLPVNHLRPTAGAEGLLRGRVRQGRMDYSVGSLFVFELLKCARRVNESPRVVGSMLRFYGYVSSCVRRDPRLLGDEIVESLRQEQTQRLRDLLRQGQRE